MIEVYKYGGNLLKYKENRRKIYKFIKERISKGNKLFIVVSALGRKGDYFSTDNLSENTQLLSNSEKDRVMTFGEIYSSLIIKNELLKEDVKVTSVDYNEIGIICDNEYQNGNILSVDMSYLESLIKEFDVVIVPGFIGESMEGKIISLGRNTSDLTALIIGDYFKVNKVNIIEEVGGVYKQDIANVISNKIINNISYDEVLSLIKAGSNIFSNKTIKFAKDKGIVIEVKGLDNEVGTIISYKESEEEVLFVNKDNEEIKVVFKDMDVFNKIFKDLIDNKVKLDDLFIIKDIVYIKGNVNDILDKYL